MGICLIFEYGRRYTLSNAALHQLLRLAFMCRHAAVRGLGLVTKTSTAPSASCTQQVEGRIAPAYKRSQKSWIESATEGEKKSVPDLPLFPQQKAVISLGVHEPLQRPSGHLPVSKASQGVLNVSGYFCDRGQGESSYLECTLSYEDKKIQFARFLEITFQESKEITIFSETILNRGIKVLLQLCFCADHFRQIQFGGLP